MKNKTGKCKQCGKRTRLKFCCHRCSWTWHNRNRKLTPNAIYDCKVCGKHVEKWVSPKTIKEGINTLEYCSRTCAGKGRMGENHHMWNGGRCLDKDGYVMIYAPGHPNATARGYVQEHRLVMEKHLGRYLTREEVVHHKNDDPSDNRIENLHLYPNNAEHKREDSKKRERDSKGRLVKKRGK